jgi:site-specific DNA-cytosine methylase
VIANTVQASTGHHGHSSPRGDGSDNLVVESAFVVEPETGQGADLKARPCDVSPTVAATDGARQTDRGVRIAGPLGVRRLLPIECERLQGFPDSWTDIPGSSDAKRYRAIGNAVAVPVIEWIGERFRDTT